MSNPEDYLALVKSLDCALSRDTYTSNFEGRGTGKQGIMAIPTHFKK